MKTMPKEHLAWVDLLRIIACFLVIIAHACDPFVGQLNNNYSEFLTGVSLGSLVRACVPLFVMMSGVLLLPIKMDMATFYSKRAKRLALPFIFWSIALPLLYYLYATVLGIQSASPNIDPSNFTLEETLKKMYLFIFNFNYDTTVLWYVYMLIGLYLFMPIIGGWLNQASKRDVQWFLRIWLISTLLPIIQLLAPLMGYNGTGLLGVCDWNAFGTFYYFSGFLGYIVLAYYLVKYPLNWRWSRTILTASSLFVIGYAITLFGFLDIHSKFPGDFPKFEGIWNFSGINVVLMTFAVFIVMQKISLKTTPLLTKIASFTFGIFLLHFIVVQAGYDLIHPNLPIPAFLQVLLISIFAFIVSLVIIWLMSLNKITRKVIM